MNRKIVGLVFALVMTLLSGCAGKVQEEANDKNNVATVETVADISEEVKQETVQEVIQENENETEQEVVQETAQETQEQVELGEVEELGEFGWRLPEGFKTYQEQPGMFVCRDYPNKIACISYLIADFDGNREELNESIIKERLEKEILDSHAETVEVTVNKFNEYQIDGCDAVRTEVSFELLGAEYELLQLLVFNETGAENYIINYIQEKGESYMDAFRRSADSISFQNE